MRKVRIISLYVMCLFSIYCGKSKADKNWDNLVKIKAGMRLEEVIKIMGKPDTVIIEPLKETQDWYMYEAPFGMSDNFYIYISCKDSIVMGINDGT